MSCWLIKSEPATYSFQDLWRDKKTFWNGVRNYQARNNLKTMQKGDDLLFYHSGEDKAVMGTAQVLCAFYPDHTATDGKDWVMVDVKPVKKFEAPVTLAQIKANKKLQKMILIKQSRLSVMPVTQLEFDEICKQGTV